jgi:hypothetical protein
MRVFSVALCAAAIAVAALPGAAAARAAPAQQEHAPTYPCTSDCKSREGGYRWAEHYAIDNLDRCKGANQQFIDGCRDFVNELAARGNNDEDDNDYGHNGRSRNDYGQSGNDYGRGREEYGRGRDDYSRGRDDYSRGDNDSDDDGYNDNDEDDYNDNDNDNEDDNDDEDDDGGRST